MKLVPRTIFQRSFYVLCSEGLVVHEEEVNFTDVVDEEGLVTGGHHVSCLLVGSETNLYPLSAIALLLSSSSVVRSRVR